MPGCENFVVTCHFPTQFRRDLKQILIKITQIASFSAVLPWVVCDPSVELENTVCIASGEDSDRVYQQLLANGTLREGQNVSFISSAEQYFL